MKQVAVHGVIFDLSTPYVEGQKLSDIEANVLNQTRIENICNNKRKWIKEQIDAGVSQEKIQEALTEYDKNFEFRVRAAAIQVDPVTREAIKLSKDIIRAHLAKTGRKINVPPAGISPVEWENKIEEQVQALIIKPELIKKAKELLDSKKKAAKIAAEGLK